jgi:hypothetical protein
MPCTCRPGTLPISWANWGVSLRALQLEGLTRLAGPLPPTLTTWWPSLQELILFNCPALGGFLPEPWGWPNLQAFAMAETGMSVSPASPFWLLDTTRRGADVLPQLMGVYLAGVAGLGPMSMHDVKAALAHHGWQLQYLGLAGCGLAGPIGPLAGLMPQLAVLNLSNNSLDGQLPSDLTQLSNLQELDLSNNNIRGELHI